MLLACSKNIDAMEKKPYNERRAEPRIKTEEPVGVHVRGGVHSGLGRLVDINNKGALIETEMTLEPGVVVTLEIDVPGSTEPETVRGVVARRAMDSTVGLGIEFLPTTVDERDHIHFVVMTILALDLLAYETRQEPAEARAVVPPASRSNDESA